ncbi:hypothetical protein PAHAL_3G099700, partial [Panicum hallii]
MVIGSHLPAYPGYRALRPLAGWRASPSSRSAPSPLPPLRLLLRSGPTKTHEDTFAARPLPPRPIPTRRHPHPAAAPPRSDGPRARHVAVVFLPHPTIYPPPHAAGRPTSPLSFPSPPNRRARVRVSLHPRTRVFRLGPGGS